MQQTLGSRAALRRALLLREILGPPKSLQAADDARTQPPADQQPGGSIKTQNGSYQNGVSTVPHPNGHRQLSPGVDADRPPASMLPAASAMPPRTGPADHAPPDEKTTTPSPTGLAASIVEASAGAIKRLFQRVGIWP